jgi:hypothetical protein
MLSTNGRQDIKKTLVHSCLLQHHSRVWNLGVTRVGTWSHVWGSLLLGFVCECVFVCVCVCVCVCVSVCLCVCVSVCNLAVTCREVGAIQAFPAGPRLLVPLSFGEPYMKGHRASPPGTQCDSTGICSPGPSKLSPFLPC